MLCYHMLAPELGHVAQMPMFERRPLPAMTSLWRVGCSSLSPNRPWSVLLSIAARVQNADAAKPSCTVSLSLASKRNWMLPVLVVADQARYWWH